MITVNGNPAAKVKSLGEGDDCASDLVWNAPQDICTECRQVSVWASRMLSWAKNKNSRVSRLIGTWLQSDQDILDSYCGFCMLRDDLTGLAECECFLTLYRLHGLPMTIQYLTGYDDCLKIGRESEATVCGVTSCWFLECDRQLCEVCNERDLDPCNVPEDRALMERILENHIFKRSHRPTPANILKSAKILFPDTAPQIVRHDAESIYLYLGRPMTAAELQIREFLALSLLTSFGVKLEIVQPC